jgi:hypothetical protein
MPNARKAPIMSSLITSGTGIQLAPNVDDLAEAIAFHTRLFGVSPHKQGPGYANFAVRIRR